MSANVAGLPMAWWKRIFRWKADTSLYGLEYKVAFRLYSIDGQREVEVREFSNGETYLVEREQIDGTFTNRHDGRLVGPFDCPEDAEEFIVATVWFVGRED